VRCVYVRRAIRVFRFPNVSRNAAFASSYAYVYVRYILCTLARCTCTRPPACGVYIPRKKIRRITLRFFFFLQKTYGLAVLMGRPSDNPTAAVVKTYFLLNKLGKFGFSRGNAGRRRPVSPPRLVSPVLNFTSSYVRHVSHRVIGSYAI